MTRPPDEWWSWYNDYLESPEWEAVRQVAFRVYGRVCANCGRRERHLGVGEWLEIDHLSYDNVGHELLEDVQVLCNTCHRKKTSRDRRRRKVKRWLGV